MDNDWMFLTKSLKTISMTHTICAVFEQKRSALGLAFVYKASFITRILIWSS